MSYFFDTYALVEIVKGNENYRNYSELIFTTTTLNLSEFYFFLLSNLSEEKAKETLNKLKFSFVAVTQEISLEAAKFRKTNYKRKLSYIDCIGYLISKKMNFKFLTGEEFFQNLDNVEFVK